MVNYAERMQGVKPSDVREILKLTARPEIISFAGGLPAPELFPVDDIRVASDLVLKEAGPVALQYATTEGNPKLREQIAEAKEAYKSGAPCDEPCEETVILPVEETAE